jgi:hypothetical protein
MNTCPLSPDEQLFAVMAKAAYAATNELKLQVLIDQYGTTGGWIIDVRLSTSETTVFTHFTQQCVVTSLRGSVTLYDWVVSDVILAIGHRKHSPRFMTTKVQVEKILAKYPTWKHYVTGHSLGGALSAQVGMTFPQITAYSFNQGSGLKDLSRNTTNNLKQYFVSNDPLSFLGQKKTSKVIHQNATNPHTLDNFICRTSLTDTYVQGIHPDQFGLYLNKATS